MGDKIKGVSEAQGTDTPTVSSKILAAFVEAIIADEEIPGVGERLKRTLLENREFSEAALRQALFGDPAP